MRNEIQTLHWPIPEVSTWDIDYQKLSQRWKVGMKVAAGPGFSSGNCRIPPDNYEPPVRKTLAELSAFNK